MAKSDPLVAVSEANFIVGVVPYEPSLLSHPVAANNELVKIGRYVYLMPYVTFAHSEVNGGNAFDEHVLAIGKTGARQVVSSNGASSQR